MPIFDSYFYKNPKATTLDSSVSVCQKIDDHFEVQVQACIFYPEGGGQPGDIGFLNDIQVIDTIEKNNHIVLITNEYIQKGTQVKEKIDVAHRMKYMLWHTAEHIFSGLMHKAHGCENVSFHMSDTIQCEFNKALSFEDIQKIEAKSNEIVRKNVPIKTYFLNNQENLIYRSKKNIVEETRIVEIEDVDRCACCGLHMETTGEIGLIKVVKYMKTPRGVKVFLLAGSEAMQYIQQQYIQSLEISQLLKTPIENIAKSVKDLHNEKEKLLNARNYWIQKYGEKILANMEGNVLLICDSQYFRNMSKLLLSRIHILIILSPEGRYLIISNQEDLTLYKSKLAVLGGKGGGKKDLLQGQFDSDWDTILTVLREVFNGLQECVI